MKYHWSNFKGVDPTELNSIYHTPLCFCKVSKNYTYSLKELKKYWFDNIDRHIYNNYNVPILKIIKFMDIEYTEVTQPGWDSAIKTNKTDAYIWVNKSLTLQQKNFLAAQMLWYLLLSKESNNIEHKTTYTQFPIKNNEIYWEYAADLLIPNYLFNTICNTQTGPDISFTNKIKSLYDPKIRRQNKEIKNNYNIFENIAYKLNVPKAVLIEKTSNNRIKK